MCAVSGKGLPAPDDGIDVARIELQSVTAPAGSLRRHDGGAATHKGIKDNVAPGRAIHDGVGHQGDRLHGRVQRKEIALFSRSTRTIHSRVVPDIAAMAAKLTKLHVVAVWGMAVLEHEHQLVLAAIERAHAGIMLGPDA